MFPGSRQGRETACRQPLGRLPQSQVSSASTAAVSPPGTRRAHVVDRADPTKRPSTRRVLGIWSLGKRMPPEQWWPRLPWAAGREASSSSRWAPGTPPTPRRSTYSHAAPSPLGHSWNGHEKVPCILKGGCSPHIPSFPSHMQREELSSKRPQ